MQDEFDLEQGRAESSISRWWLLGGFVVLACVALGAYLWLDAADEVAALLLVTADSGRLTLTKDDRGNLTTIDAGSSPELYYRVTLRGAPLGRGIWLACDWLAPGGQVVHRNHYQTKAVDKAVWPTHARCQFGPTSPLGQWTVRMSLGDREISSAQFMVELRPADGAAQRAADAAEAGR